MISLGAPEAGEKERGQDCKDQDAASDQRDDGGSGSRRRLSSARAGQGDA
jgi:hypothetical protein